MLGGGGERDRSEPATDELEYEFETKNVSEAEDYQLGYYGSYAYVDDDGRERHVEREFEVYTDDAHRTDGMPLAHVREVDSADADEQVESREFEVPVEVDPDKRGIALKSGVKAYLDRWNRENADRR